MQATEAKRKRRSDYDVLLNTGVIRHAPELIPIFGAQLGWGADRACSDIHPGGPIPSGSRCVCMSCHKSGVDGVACRHVKPGSGQLREGWDGPQATKYSRPKGGLKGGVGR